MKLGRWILFWAAFLIGVPQVDAQVKSHTPPRPKRAAILSALIPGAGQIYNKRIWKAPLVWAGLGGFGYGIIFNARQYRRFKKAFRERKDPNIFDEFDIDLGDGTRIQVLTEDDIKNFREAAQKDLELTYIGLVAVWGLNVLEAYVDAHLQNFDINYDLSFRVRPSSTNFGDGMVGGAGVTFTF